MKKTNQLTWSVQEDGKHAASAFGMRFKLTHEAWAASPTWRLIAYDDNDQGRDAINSTFESWQSARSKAQRSIELRVNLLQP